MSFGISIGDILKAIEVAFTIYEKCFSKAHGANVKYLQFGKDIKALENNLRQLQKIFTHAFSQDQQRPWRHQREELGPSLQPLLEVTGDFNTTLKECNSLLADRSRFHRSSGNFVNNVSWWASTEKDVDALKVRVHFHVTKTFFVIKPFEIHLLLGIRDELQALREDVRAIKGLLICDPVAYRTEASAIPSLPPVPGVTSARFTAALDVNPPRSFQGVENFPLKEGFDALVFHLGQSTVEFNPGLDVSQRVPEDTQYLNLLKTNFILGKLKGSIRFQEAGPSSLWVDYMKELEKDILKEYLRFSYNQLIAPPQDDIQRLPDSCFSIWMTEAKPQQPPNLAEKRPFEDKILELDLRVSLGTLKETLTLLRKSEINMRLVITNTDERNKDFLREQSFEFSIHQTKFVPAYAVPEASADSSSSTNNVLLCCPGQEPKWYYLKNSSDVEVFQQAITGYRIFHDVPAVEWSFNGSNNANKSGKGRMQLWQLDHLQPIVPEDLTVSMSLQRMSTNTTIPKSSLASPNKEKRSSILSGSSLCSSSSVTSVVTGPRGKATAILKPASPVIVIHTMYHGKYTFIYLPLLESLYIEPKSCKCRHLINSCRRVVIESTTGRIEIRRLFAQQDGTAGLYTWDLAVFSNPRHPEFINAEEVPKVKYLCLDFPNIEEKEKFCEEFQSIISLRNADIRDYERDIRERRHQANHPPRR